MASYNLIEIKGLVCPQGEDGLALSKGLTNDLLGLTSLTRQPPLGLRDKVLVLKQVTAEMLLHPYCQPDRGKSLLSARSLGSLVPTSPSASSN
jgi:hypothetical protein